MPRDKNGREPGDDGYTLSGMSDKQKKQAQAILISMAKAKEGKK